MTLRAPEMVVLDASIVVKLASRRGEPDTRLAQQLYQQVKNGALRAIAPDFLLIETAHVLRWKKKLSAEHVEKFLRRLLTSGIRFFSIPFERSPEIVSIMDRYRLSAYDSLYVLAALDHKYPLVTADERLSKVPGVGLSLQEFYHQN